MRYYCRSCGAEFKIAPDYETPEQYAERTGKAYPEKGAVWICDGLLISDPRWGLTTYKDARRYMEEGLHVVIADPSVPPPDEWRPGTRTEKQNHER